MPRLLKWSNNQLRSRLKIAHAIIDEAVKVNEELSRKLKSCQEWTAQREALVATPTMEQIADIVSGKPQVKRVKL